MGHNILRQFALLVILAILMIASLSEANQTCGNYSGVDIISSKLWKSCYLQAASP